MTSLAVQQQSLLPSSSEWTQMLQMAASLLKSQFLPTSIKTPEAAVAIMLKGRELRVPPMQAFAQISVINGKPTMNAELMLALVRRDFPASDVQIVENSSTGATVKARRQKAEPYATFTFLEEDARRAGLLSKGPWQQYPKSMYLWRAISMMCRAVFPDSLMGVSHTPEELGASIDEEGNVIDVSPSHAPVALKSAPAADSQPVSLKSRATVYNHADTEMQRMLAGVLKGMKVDEGEWEAIGAKLDGRPSTDIKAAISEARSEASHAGT